MTVLDEIAAEWQRHSEGWSAPHDDKHDKKELAAMAACYAVGDLLRSSSGNGIYPFQPGWWKPTGHRRNLIKAAALIVAEVERLDRRYLNEEAIVERLLSTLDRRDMEYLKLIDDEGELAGLHHTLGQWIRNTFHLWEPENPFTKYDAPPNPETNIIDDPQFPDAVSQRIIVALWKKVRDQ